MRPIRVKECLIAEDKVNWAVLIKAENLVYDKEEQLLSPHFKKILKRTPKLVFGLRDNVSKLRDIDISKSPIIGP